MSIDQGEHEKAQEGSKAVERLRESIDLRLGVGYSCAMGGSD